MKVCAFLVAFALVVLLLLFFVSWDEAPAPASPPKTETFSPYESTLVHDMKRSDPSGDVPEYPDNVPSRNNESFLFNQLILGNPDLQGPQDSLVFHNNF
jgi:hypothetical protein